MKQKHMMMVAIACGLVCALCVGLFMLSVRNEAEKARNEALARFGGEQVEAYVATRDIVAGERLDLSAVESKLWVADLLPERAVRSASDAVGKTATSSIYKGEVITSGRFEIGKDAIDVPAGKQAVSVPAKAVQAVGGAIRAGMSVDVYSSGGSSTTVLANGVNVLDTSVGASNSLSSGGDGWITLAVEPDKVEEIIAASNKTTLYFTLPGESENKGGEASADGKGKGKDGLSAKEATASIAARLTESEPGKAKSPEEPERDGDEYDEDEERYGEEEDDDEYGEEYYYNEEEEEDE